MATDLLPAASTVSSVDPSPAVAAVEETTAVAQPSILADLIELTKPRIVVMILVTTLATAMIGAGGMVGGFSLVLLLIGTAAVAGSAGAANQVWERRIDRHMTRTATRPMPTGRIKLPLAVAYAAVLLIAGTSILAWRFGWTPAAVGVATWALYVLIYTPMKVRTQWNTTVGAIAGALPVLIGYTACGGTLLDPTGWLLVGVLAAWQYPHFMAIAWMYRRQYDEAGFRMTTTVEPTGRNAAIQSIAGSIAVIACGVTMCWLTPGLLAAVLATLGVTLSVLPMLRASVRFAGQANDAAARGMLRASLIVLPMVLLIVTLRVFF